MALWEILKAQKLGCSDDLFARLAAERLNGGRMRRNTIIIQHSAGTFKATAEGKNVVWKYGAQEIHGNTCNFTVTEDNAQILVSFDGLLTKFVNQSDGQTLLDLADLGGKITYYLSLYNCKNITGSLADLGGKITYYLSLYNCKNITGSLADLGGKITYLLSLYNCQNITGSLSDLGGKITYYLSLDNCQNITGSLSDLGGKITYYLSLDNCQNITGSLSDLGGKITYYLSLYNCKNITGSLADLSGKITYLLSLYNCKNITGSLADLGGRITHYLSLYNCKNITGVYSGNSYPTNVNLSNTGLTAADMDQTLINFNAGTTKSGTFTATGMTRTAASDAAVAGLIAKGWTLTGLEKVEG